MTEFESYVDIAEYYEKKYKSISYITKEDKNAVENEFKLALENHYNIQKHKKRDKLYEIAWQQGHDYGFREVASYYDDMVDLLI